MRYLLLFFICLFNLNFVYSQINETRVSYYSRKYEKCDLEKRNSIWLEEINREKNDSIRILKIKEKINSDTIYKRAIDKNLIIRDSFLNFENVDSNGNLCGTKILFILYYKKRKSIYLNLEQNPEYKEIVENLNVRNVNVYILNPTSGATAIYGVRGSSGAVVLKTNDKNLKKLIKKSLKSTTI